MKYLTRFGVIMLVVVLPAGSWYYLQTGLNYRKAALKELTPKGILDKQVLADAPRMQSHTSLVQLKEDEKLSNKIYDQYGAAETFQLLTLNGNEDHENWIAVGANTLQKMSANYPNAAFMLLDTSIQIRNVYIGGAQEVAKEVVSHVAMVLPRKKDKDIKIKNNDGQ